MKCTDRQQVQLVACMFLQVAETWWWIVEPTYAHMVDNIVWATYMIDFQKKFILDHRGDITVQLYEIRFKQLSTFTLELVAMKQQMIH